MRAAYNPRMASSLTPIVLAAGASTRMGSPKPLLDLGGKPALGQVLQACKDAALSRPLVVLGHGAEEIRKAVDPALADVVVNPQPDRGMTSSLQEGLKHLPADARGFLLFPADYPLVTWEDLVLLEERFEHDHRHQIYIPTHEGRRGHPVACDRRIAEEILALAPDQPAHLVIRKDPKRIMEVPVLNPWVCRDLDTPEDLEAARAFLAR